MNAAVPGFLATDMTHRLADEQREQIVRHSALRRLTNVKVWRTRSSTNPAANLAQYSSQQSANVRLASSPSLPERCSKARCSAIFVSAYCLRW